MPKNRARLPWNKLLAIALLGTVVAYVLARPTLERWWGVSLPALTENSPTISSEQSPRKQDPVKVPENLKSKAPAQSGFEKSASEQSDSRKSKSEVDKSTANNENSGTVESGTTRSEKTRTPKGKDPKWELKQIDRSQLLSPAGLIYSPGPQGEHRVDHVMRHGKDDPNRPQHGVFNGSRDEILQLLDEAYLMIQQNPKRFSPRADGNRTEYTVRFDRPIGFEGGRSGLRNNHPAVNRLRLVVEDGKYVVTAYPVK